MSDFPYVGPPPGGLVEAMGTARVRRLRTASTTSGVSALMVLVVALLAGQTGRTNLVQGPKTEVPAVTTNIDDATTSGEHDKSATIASGPTTLTFSSTASLPSAPVPPAALPAASTGRAPTSHINRPQAPAGPTYKAGPIQRSNSQLNVATSCLNPSDAMCQSSTYTDYGPAEAPHELTASVCSSDANPVFLHYAGTTEVDFTVLDPKGHEVWRWSTWHPLGETPHTLTLQTGDCLAWVFDWTGVDRRGVALPKAGGYVMRTLFRADELTRRATPDVTFTLT